MSASWRVELGDCVERLAALLEASIDAIVTDPPYGIGFMGHDWDQPGEFGAVRGNGRPAPFASGRRQEGPHVPGRVGIPSGQRRDSQPAPSGFTSGVPGNGGALEAGRYDLSLTANRRFQAWCEAWSAEAFRVLKPGGHLLVFGGTRTYHRLAAGVEDAGFEIRDCIAWLFGSGFPKSRNLDGDWDGWGTALKPAFEPIVVARKPLVGTVAANVLEHGTGALNIDGCRIEFSGEADEAESKDKNQHAAHGNGARANAVFGEDLRQRDDYDPPGRWPANVVMDSEAGAVLDAQTGELAPGNHPAQRQGIGYTMNGETNTGTNGDRRPTEPGGASRFFYCAKASRAERNAGLDAFEKKPLLWSSGEQNPGSFQSDGTEREARNPHPTVKPIDLMRWLVRMVTPPGGTVLDPFVGSGTTGCAAVLEGFQFVGIERDPDYAKVAEARIGWWASQPDGIDVDDALEGDARRRKVAETGQASLL